MRIFSFQADERVAFMIGGLGVVNGVAIWAFIGLSSRLGGGARLWPRESKCGPSIYREKS
ncbi:MAG: hypothetical protein DME25_03355 [Verrucomicrobia bacterium]|nr:MAG: hypothetical protein DME25_03355 [Verrucomicrobiota bacterium]